LSDINAKLSGNRKTLITWLVIYLWGILNQHSATITVYNQKLIRKKPPNVVLQREEVNQAGT